MADGTILERRGVQTAAIVTDSFRRPGDAMAKVQGYPGYHYAAMQHPISSLNQDQICERAKAILPEVLDILGLEGTDSAEG